MSDAVVVSGNLAQPVGPVVARSELAGDRIARADSGRARAPVARTEAAHSCSARILFVRPIAVCCAAFRRVAHRRPRRRPSVARRRSQ